MLTEVQAGWRVLCWLLPDVDLDTAVLGHHQRAGSDIVVFRYPRRSLSVHPRHGIACACERDGTVYLRPAVKTLRKEARKHHLRLVFYIGNNLAAFLEQAQRHGHPRRH